MRLVSLARVGSAIGMLASVLLIAATLASAEEGRDFAGFYGLSNVVDLGEEVAATFTLEIFNYSGADVTSATVTVENFLLPGEMYASFMPVDIPYRQNAQLVQAVLVIPPWEYDNWQNGGSPNVQISFTDAAGNMVVRGVELTWMLFE